MKAKTTKSVELIIPRTRAIAGAIVGLVPLAVQIIGLYILLFDPEQKNKLIGLGACIVMLLLAKNRDFKKLSLLWGFLKITK